MKILYHHRIRSKDGQFVHIDEMVTALRRRGHDVVLVGPPIIESSAFGAGSGGIALLKRYLPRFLYELMEIGYALVAYRRLKAAYLRHRPDALFERYNLYQPAGVWLRRRYRLPMLLEVNSPLAEERSREDGLAFRRLARWAERYIWRHVDNVLPATHVLATDIGAAGVPGDRITVLRNGVDLKRFETPRDGDAAKRALGLEDRMVLGFTGFVRSWHRVDRVIDFMADSDPALALHLLLVGDGPARADLEAQALHRGVADRLTITGVVPRGAVRDHVAAFDVALNLDRVPYALALKLFEYMAMGRAIVAHDWPNIREILTDGENAMLFDPDDEAAFARAMTRLCGDAALRRRIGDAARRTIDEKGLTWDDNARRVETLYDGLLAEGAAAAVTADPPLKVPQ